MELALQRATEQLIAEQVRSGRFSTPEAVVDEALALLARVPTSGTTESDGGIAWDESLDDEDLAAIAESDAQGERGEGITDLETFRREMAKWIASPE